MTDTTTAQAAPIQSAELAELRKLAEKAHPGPWRAGATSLVAPETDDHLEISFKASNGNRDVLRHTARYFAAANPAVVLALLATIESQRQVIAGEVPEHLREFVEAIAYTYDRADGDDESVCLGCSGLIEHDAGSKKEYAHHRPDCIVLRAQAVLAPVAPHQESAA